MGILDRLLGAGERDSDGKPRPAKAKSFRGDERPDASFVIEDNGYDLGRRASVTIGEESFSGLSIAASASGDCFAFYSQRTPVFVFTSQQELLSIISRERVFDAAVADDGTVAISHVAGDGNRGGQVEVLSNGEPLCTWEYDSNIGPVAITADGRYAATSTFGPDFATYLLDVENCDTRLKHENTDGHNESLAFRDENGDPLLCLFKRGQIEPHYALTLDGEVVEKSVQKELAERKARLMSGDHSLGQDELITELDALIDDFDDANETKPLSLMLGDIHWTIAKEIKSAEGVTDDCWSHLTEAYLRYSFVPTWADGRKGIAKVRRLQGNLYLDEGDEEMARQMFQEIADLAEEYNVQLLTDADRKKLDRLSA